MSSTPPPPGGAGRLRSRWIPVPNQSLNAASNASTSSGREINDARPAQYRSSRSRRPSAPAERQNVTMRPAPTGRPRPRTERPKPIRRSSAPASGAFAAIDDLAQPFGRELLIVVILQHRAERDCGGLFVQVLCPEERGRVGPVDRLGDARTLRDVE